MIVSSYFKEAVTVVVVVVVENFAFVFVFVSVVVLSSSIRDGMYLTGQMHSSNNTNN